MIDNILRETYESGVVKVERVEKVFKYDINRFYYAII